MNRIAVWTNVRSQKGIAEYDDSFQAHSWKKFPEEAWAWAMINNTPDPNMIYFDPRCIGEATNFNGTPDGYPLPRNWFFA